MTALPAAKTERGGALGAGSDHLHHKIRLLGELSSPCPYRAQYRLKAVVQAPLEDHVSESAAPIMRLQAVKLVGLVIEGIEVGEHEVALDAARVAHS
jgi:hypothetical protein